MHVEAALFFEPLEQVYARVFRLFRPRTPVPTIKIRFCKYASIASRIKWSDDCLSVNISDLLEQAPAPIQEALAYILLAKLFRKTPEPNAVALYRRYLRLGEIQSKAYSAQQSRGRKHFHGPQGAVYNLESIFAHLNAQYFNGELLQPRLGWSRKPSRTTLGHYDPPHHAIVISSLLDSPRCSELLIHFVMFHEMLHLRHPTEYNGARRCVHTKEFKTAEEKFEEFEEAKTALRAFVEASWRSPSA